MSKETTDKEFGLEDEKFYFKQEVKKSNVIFNFLLIVLMAIFLYIIQINWLNLNQYNQIKSNENYPVETIFKEQIAYYGSDYSATSFITDFYKFPFESLAVNDIQKNTQSIKYLSNVKEIRVDYDYETYQVFNMSGNLISSGNSSKTIFTNGWNKGVYVIKTIDKQGKANTAKILVF